jgi:hypothetical protein
VQDRSEDSIKDRNFGSKGHSSIGVQTIHIDENLEQEIIMAEKAQSCDDCGLLFDSTQYPETRKTRLASRKRRSSVKKAKKKEDGNDVIEEDRRHLGLSAFVVSYLTV